MQNRSMFPYRRHGAKKRSKGGGAAGVPRHSRGAPRTLPNSARDLLPLLQPAIKALAQMLAGRTRASGQLNHARTMLAHAERLIADGVHNRLPPAEREEFFEQLARLRLTLADADVEAEVQAAEDQVPKEPPPPPVAQERLREMALALTKRRPEPHRQVEPAAATPDRSAPPVAAGGDAAAEATVGPDDEAPAPARVLKPLSELPGRLVLSKAAGDTARRAVGEPIARRARARAAGLTGPPAASPSDAPSEAAAVEQAAPAAHTGGNGATPETGEGESEAEKKPVKVARRRRKTEAGLPEGWVIDEEGYVVPGRD